MIEGNLRSRMNKLYTKSSAEAKLSEDDIKIFSRVCEKGINEFTQKNMEFTADFELDEETRYKYGLKKIRVLKELQKNQFSKIAISDKCAIAVEIIKNKAFIKCYQSETLILEIAMSTKQLEAIEDKYYYDIERFDKCGPRQKYQIFYAGTFMRKDDQAPLSSKLNDLRLLKIVNMIDVKN